MKYSCLLLFIILLTASCRKMRTYTCATPQLLLTQQGYDSTQWDTVITRVYSSGYKPPVITDTFIAKDTGDMLLVNPGDAKDFEIFLPSVNRTHRLHGITVTPETYEAKEGREVKCYNTISYTLDGQTVTNATAAGGNAFATLKK